MPRGIPNAKPESDELETLPTDFNKRTYSWVTFGKGQKGEDLFVVGAHNGVTWRYKRGIRLPVPDMFIKGCLDVSVTTYLDQEANEMREAPSYPYTVHGPATLEEVLAWQAANK